MTTMTTATKTVWGSVLLSVLLTVACAGGDSNPAAPSTPTPPPAPPPPQQQLYTLTGRVTSVATQQAIGGALVRVVDGPNAGMQTATDGDGRYTLSGLTFAGFTVSVQAGGFVEGARGGLLTAGSLTSTANFALLPAAPWTQSGGGNTVFTMPSYFTRVAVHGHLRTNASSSNFQVKVGGRLMVNEILSKAGRYGWQTTYDGVHLTTGGTVEITNSSDIAWSFTEQR